MSWVRGKSSGWAAVNLKQQKRGLQDEIEPESFPPISTTLSSLPPHGNLHRVDSRSGRPFSSALLPSADSLTLPETSGAKKTVLGDSSIQGGKKVIEEIFLALRKLKELHSWADFRLIEDVMEAVNNNINEASILLKAMVSNETFENNNEMSTLGLHSYNDISCSGKNNVSVPLEKTVNIPILSSTIKNVHQNNIACDEDDTKLIEDNYCERNFFHNVGNPKLSLGCSNSVPIEPEWEEDDIYLSHRKDAISMIR